MNRQLVSALCIATFFQGCGPSDLHRASESGKQEAACRDQPCPGDVAPQITDDTLVALKFNGQWFAGPRAYFSQGRGGAVFYWPSKAPLTGIDGKGGLPPSVAGQKFETVAIQIFLRSGDIPAYPRDYRLIQLADKNGWIASRKVVRPGLERIEMKHVADASGSFIDNASYYVATDIADLEGLPPVATCFHGSPDGFGGTGFIWKPGIWAGVRMNQAHCAEWPEIYQEVIRVLQLLKKV